MFRVGGVSTISKQARLLCNRFFPYKTQSSSTKYTFVKVLARIPTGDDSECPNITAEENYIPDENGFEPRKFSQAEANDLVRDLPSQRRKLNCWYQD